MFLAQLAVSAVVWGFVIARMLRDRESLIHSASTLSRGQRARNAAATLLLSVIILGLGMLALYKGGLTDHGLSWWGWPLITFVGAAFVVLQTLALVPLLLNAVQPVTRGYDGSSDTIGSDRP